MTHVVHQPQPAASAALIDVLARRDWENPAVTHYGKLPSHAPFMSYRDKDAARVGDDSPSHLSLDGEWQFSYFPRPEAVPESWLTPTPASSRSPVTGSGPATIALSIPTLNTPSRSIRRVYRRAIPPDVMRAAYICRPSGRLAAARALFFTASVRPFISSAMANGWATPRTAACRPNSI